eukprot:GHRQ01038920.1.p1 GENE.GHRQ01038920.1~~GHRQ01038920.1.p1  ORF type:complete len:122 (-),score=6.83 GHRQ01038920.1:495-860(-)
MLPSPSMRLGAEASSVADSGAPTAHTTLLALPMAAAMPSGSSRSNSTHCSRDSCSGTSSPNCSAMSVLDLAASTLRAPARTLKPAARSSLQLINGRVVHTRADVWEEAGETARHIQRSSLG